MEAVENIKLQEGQKNILRITSHVLYHKSVNQTNYNYALFIPSTTLKKKQISSSEAKHMDTCWGSVMHEGVNVTVSCSSEAGRSCSTQGRFTYCLFYCNE